jgi:transposase-like protein
LSVPKIGLHKKVFQNRKMSIKNERPNKKGSGRVSTFSESFKVQVALEYLDGDYSCPQVAKKYDLSTKTVEWFVLWYRKNNPVIMPEESGEAHQSSLSEQEHKDLEKKLALAEMKIAALEKVIAIANEEYRTDLKKKAAIK